MNQFDSDFWKLAKKEESQKVVKKEDQKIRNTRKWNDKYKIITLGAVRKIDDKAKSRKLFIINFEFKDDKDKKHRASVRFGMKNQKYFITNGDKEESKIFSQKCKHLKNPFHNSYWEMHLLNSCSTIQEAHAKYRIQNDIL